MVRMIRDDGTLTNPHPQPHPHPHPRKRTGVVIVVMQITPEPVMGSDIVINVVLKDLVLLLQSPGLIGPGQPQMMEGVIIRAQLHVMQPRPIPRMQEDIVDAVVLN